MRTFRHAASALLPWLLLRMSSADALRKLGGAPFFSSLPVPNDKCRLFMDELNPFFHQKLWPAMKDLWELSSMSEHHLSSMEGVVNEAIDDVWNWKVGSANNLMLGPYGEAQQLKSEIVSTIHTLSPLFSELSDLLTGPLTDCLKKAVEEEVSGVPDEPKKDSRGFYRVDVTTGKKTTELDLYIKLVDGVVNTLIKYLESVISTDLCKVIPDWSIGGEVGDSLGSPLALTGDISVRSLCETPMELLQLNLQLTKTFLENKIAFLKWDLEKRKAFNNQLHFNMEAANYKNILLLMEMQEENRGQTAPPSQATTNEPTMASTSEQPTTSSTSEAPTPSSSASPSRKPTFSPSETQTEPPAKSAEPEKSVKSAMTWDIKT